MRHPGGSVDKAIEVYTFPSQQQLEVIQGDITAEKTEAIVNAANRYLEHGAGVAGAIVRKGGAQVQVESRQWVNEHGLVTHTEPAYTHAGNLPCRYVIHAVGPMWGEGDEETKLADAIRGSLRLADKLGLQSIALPAISTGIFGFPVPLAARVMLVTISDYLAENPRSSLELIRLVLFDAATWQIFIEAMNQDDHFSS